MATVTTTKKSRKSTKVNVKNTLVDFNGTLISGSEEFIDVAVNTGEKYQKLFAKSVKKSTPLVEKQVDLVFDTIETMRDQMNTGTVRFKKLIGWDDQTLTRFKKNATKRVEELKKNAEDRIETVQSELNERIPVIPAPKKAAKKVEKAAKKVVAKAKKVETPKNTAAPKTTVVDPSDIKAIDGIGPKMERILNVGGIDSIATLATSSVSTIKALIEKSGGAPRGTVVESWISQAQKINK